VCGLLGKLRNCGIGVSVVLTNFFDGRLLDEYLQPDGLQYFHEISERYALEIFRLIALELLFFHSYHPGEFFLGHPGPYFVFDNDNGKIGNVPGS